MAAEEQTFDPATLVTPGAWYMSRSGFEGTVGTDYDGLCAWARPHVDPDDPYNHRLSEEINRLRRDAGAKLSDGLPHVVGDLCGHGFRPEDHSPLPAGTSSVWDEYEHDCSRHVWAWEHHGQDWGENMSPSERCLTGHPQNTYDPVNPSQWAYPDLVKEYFPEHYPKDLHPSADANS